jgi:hypothetical protein
VREEWKGKGGEGQGARLAMKEEEGGVARRKLGPCSGFMLGCLHEKEEKERRERKEK